MANKKLQILIYNRTMQTIYCLLKSAKVKLANISSTPELDAEILLAKILNTDRSFLYAYPEKILTGEEEAEFTAVLKRRSAGEPIAYILGWQEFWSLKIKVTKDVLIPRPETELLVEKVLQKLPADEKLSIADLGTGSGAIALAVASERKHWQIIAADKSSAALRLAQENAKRLNAANITFIQSDWCAMLPDYGLDTIISNPPYVKKSDPCLNVPAMSFEPRAALESGEDGLDDLHAIIFQAEKKLKNHGWLFLEHGFDQACALMKLLKKYNYFNIRDDDDVSGTSRVIQAQIIRKDA